MHKSSSAATGDPCRASTAGGDGRFTFEDVPLGRFTVRGSAQVTGNPSVGTTGGAVLFEGDTAEATVTLLGLSIIEGSVVQIVNGNRQPAANASVRLFGQPGSGCPGACQQSADANGSFRFINVPAQTFTVSASALSGQQGSVGGTLVPGQTKSGLEIVLAPAVSLRGRARLGSGNVAPGVVAELSLNGGKLFAETDADGLFVFESVGAGAYVLLLQDPIAGGLARRTGTIVVAGEHRSRRHHARRSGTDGRRLESRRGGRGGVADPGDPSHVQRASERGHPQREHHHADWPRGPGRRTHRRARQRHGRPLQAPPWFAADGSDALHAEGQRRSATWRAGP